MAPLNLYPLSLNLLKAAPAGQHIVPAKIATTVADLVGINFAGTPANVDQWDGYTADRDSLLATLADRDRRAGNTLFLTGDIHSEWANEIHHAGRTVAAELVCSSISAANVDDMLGLPAGSPISRAGSAMQRGPSLTFDGVSLE